MIRYNSKKIFMLKVVETKDSKSSRRVHGFAFSTYLCRIQWGSIFLIKKTINLVEVFFFNEKYEGHIMVSSSSYQGYWAWNYELMFDN